MISKLEDALEVATGNALVQIVALFAVFGLLAFDSQCLPLGLNLQLRIHKAGNGHGDAVLVSAQQLDVVGGITGLALFALGDGIHQGRQVIEADGGTEQGCKIKCTHGKYPRKQYWLVLVNLSEDQVLWPASQEPRPRHPICGHQYFFQGA